MRYQLVLFDFDGTLADTFPWFAANINELADRLRFRRVAAGDVERLRGLGPREVMRQLDISWWKVPFIARSLRKKMASAAGDIRLFPGVPDMLRALDSGGITLGVLTSNAEQNVRAALGPSAAHVRHWACEASLFGKASRLRGLLRATGLPPERVLCVGDELRDAEAARAVGVDFAGVAWGFASPAALAAHGGGARVFDSVDQIVAGLLGP